MIDVSLLFDPNEHSGLSNDTNHDKKNLGYTIFNNAMIIPPKKINETWIGGVFINKQIIEHTIAPHYNCEKTTNYVDNDNFVVEENVIYIGNFVKCWGHFITDCIRYMWFVLKQTNFVSWKLAYIEDDSFQLCGNYLRLLELLGIDKRRLLKVSKPTIFKKCLVPDPSFYFNSNDNKYFYNKEYQLTINKIKSAWNVNDKERDLKIYYSYSSFVKNKHGIKKQFGEEKLESFFKNEGFLIIKPEKLSLDEQLELLSRCCIFASTEGSSSHNTIFLPKNSKAIIIPRGPYQSGYQDALNHAGDCDIIYIDSSLSVLTNSDCPWSGPFYYFISDELLSFFNRSKKGNYLRDNFRDIKKYLNYGLSLKRSNSYAADNVYSKKLFGYLSEYKRMRSFKNFLKKLFLKKLYF